MTAELRVDPLSGLRTVIVPARADRPGALPEPPAPAPEPPHAENPFAPGNEAQTPPELDRVAGPDGTWLVRAFENRWPAFTPGAQDPPREASLDLFTAVAARGAHEVVVNAPSGTTLAGLTEEQLVLAAGLWRTRMAAHPGAAHVHLHVSEGTAGGASQPHTHAQLSALDFVPAAIARERERAAAYAARSQGSDLLGDLVQAEVRQRKRLVSHDDEAVLLAPYASQVPFQLMVVPRTPTARWEEPGPLGAALLHRGLRALSLRFGHPPPLTLWVRTAPRGAEHFSWRIDVLPRLFPLGGLELGTGVAVNCIPPEQATRELREALA